jgi:ubiquinone biosynthesis protein UbiJ
MPTSALVAATLETTINKLLSLDEDSEKRLKSLSGARLTAFVSPLPYGITLSFSDRVDVLTEQDTFEHVVKTVALKRR